jgi:hypothetical protein
MRYVSKVFVFVRFDIRAHGNTSSDSDLDFDKLVLTEFDLHQLKFHKIGLTCVLRGSYRHPKLLLHLAYHLNNSELISTYLYEDQIVLGHICLCL